MLNAAYDVPTLLHSVPSNDTCSLSKSKVYDGSSGSKLYFDAKRTLFSRLGGLLGVYRSPTRVTLPYYDLAVCYPLDNSTFSFCLPHLEGTVNVNIMLYVSIGELMVKA